MDKKLAQLLAAIEDKGYIGAGPMRLTQDPNFIALKDQLGPVDEPKPVKVEPVKVAPKVVALPVRKIVRHK